MASKVTIDGRFFAVDGARFPFRGVSHGTFEPRDDGARFSEREQAKRDFAAMNERGFDVVRPTWRHPTTSSTWPPTGACGSSAACSTPTGATSPVPRGARHGACTRGAGADAAAVRGTREAMDLLGFEKGLAAMVVTEPIGSDDFPEELIDG